MSLEEPDSLDAARGRGLGWLGHRLASMSAAEIAHRFREQARRAMSRYVRPDFAGMRFGDGDLTGFPGLLDGVRRLAQDEAVLGRWRAHSRLIQSGHFSALGLEVQDGIQPPDWHRDPVTGRSWPSGLYCFDVPYRGGTGMGGVKHVWEFSRLQYLQPMAALAAATGDSELADRVVEHVMSWIAGNPPYRGVHWISGVELALRVISLLVVVSLLGERFRGERQRALLETLAAHGYWLRRFPSLHSSANNHLIAEASALYLLGRLAPQLRPAGRWAAQARAVLERETLLQFHDDGVPAEQSPTYGAFSLECLMLCAVTGERTGDPWPAAFLERLARTAGYLRAISDAGGHHPAIGDDDEGAVFWLDRSEGGHVNAMLAAAAATLKRGDLVPPKPVAGLRDAFYGAPPEPVPQPWGFRHFPVGGYSVARSLDDGRECLFTVDHGPLGHLSIAAHGHADALSVWLHIDGRPVLVDGGTYRYDSEDGWRNHFRGTASHNTLSIGGDDSSQITGPFNWGQRAEVEVLEVAQDPEAWAIEAEHDGFVERYGYRHRRRVEKLGPCVYQIIDQLIGEGSVERVEIGFLLAPDLTATSASGGWLIGDGKRRLLYLRHEGSLKGWVERGIETPKRGWYSPRYGELEAASRLVFAGKMWGGAQSRFTLATRFD